MDQSCIEKFGEDYERYMRRVPGVNFLLGIVRLLRGVEDSNPQNR
jgi:hypothetical protein